MFRQIRGFGEYGFPESHAASFALLVYVSAWLKYHYPEVFAASLINSQPMGFYAPGQLLRDLKEHGGELLPIDVNHSCWDVVLEPSQGDGPSMFKVRLGFRLMVGFSESHASVIEAARKAGAFRSLDDFTRRTKLSRAVIERLSRADAFQSIGQNRRESLWNALAQEKSPGSRPLFDRLHDDEDELTSLRLPEVQPIEDVFADYATTGLSLKAHPVSFYRDQLTQLRVVRNEELASLVSGRRVRVAGLVIMRQRPQTAKGITFVTIEDETGVANLVVHYNTWQRYYSVARRGTAWMAHGRVENKHSVIHVIVDRLELMADSIKALQSRSRDFR